MKKIIVFVLLTLLTSFFFMPKTYALDFNQIPIQNDIQWTIKEDVYGLYIESNRIFIDFQEIYMDFHPTMNFEGMADWENFIVPVQNTSYSKAIIYEDDVTTFQEAQYLIDFFYEEESDEMYLYHGSSYGRVNMIPHQGMYIQIRLMLDTSLPYNELQTYLNNLQNYLDNHRDKYFFRIELYYYFDIPATVSSLPLTSGNIYSNTGTMGTASDWTYNSTTKVFEARVTYFQEYNLSINNVSFGSHEFLDKVESIDYFTVGTDRYFQFNFEDNPNVLTSSSAANALTWNGFAVWNLSQNELVIYNRAKVLTYIDVTLDREVFGYAYIPGIPIDDIMSISGHFNYRYGYKDFWGTQKYQAWNTLGFALEHDQETYGANGIFEGSLPQWTYDVLSVSIPAVILGTALTLAGLPVIGLPLVAGGITGIVVSAGGAIDHLIHGSTQELEQITPNSVLRSKINQHYTLATGVPTVIPTNAQIYKLYFGLFTSPNTNAVEINAASLQYTEITWITNGQIYTVDDRFIDSISILDLIDQGNLPPEGEPGWFAKVWAEAKEVIIIIAIIFAGFYMLPKLDKILNSFMNIIRNPKKLLLLGVIVIVILYFTGILRL